MRTIDKIVYDKTLAEQYAGTGNQYLVTTTSGSTLPVTSFTASNLLAPGSTNS